MRRELSFGLLALTLGLAGCASHSSPSVSDTSRDNRLASATVTFATLEEGKDAKSAVNVQLLRSSNELAADAATSGTEFKDDTTTPPLAMTISVCHSACQNTSS